MTNPVLGIIVGSNRRESINRKFAQALARLAEDRFDVRFIRIDDLPMFNQDLESELFAPVTRFKADVAASNALLFVTPEHNRSVPAVLKNAIDWGTRPWGQNSWNGKLAMVTGATPGAIGTALGQEHLRFMLNVLGTLVLGGEAYITFKPELLGADGGIADEKTRQFMQDFIDKLADLTHRLAPERQRSAA